MTVTKNIPGQLDLCRNIIAQEYPISKVLDIGCGSAAPSRAFRDAGADVTATSFDINEYLGEQGNGLRDIKFVKNIDICDMSIFEDNSFDAVWCAHVLEHVLDTGKALSEVHRVLKPAGYFFVSVPPFKHQVVGGHVNAGWNIGILMYVLAVAGFDLKNSSFIRHGYNIAAVVRGGNDFSSPQPLRFANGDIETLARHGRFPDGFEARQGFNGDIEQWNWAWKIKPELNAAREEDEQDRPSGALHKKLNIAFFIPWITTGRGGTEHVGAMMANAMVERGHQATIYTFDDKQGPSQWSLDENIALRCHPETMTPEAEGRMLLELGVQNPDLIVGLHMNRQFFQSVYFGARLGVPVLLSEHTNPALPRKIGTLTEHERIAIFAGADRIHLLLEQYRETLPEFLKERVRVIPNTVARARHFADPVGAAEKPGTILCVARLVARKNVARIIEAFATALETEPNWRLQIVGYGSKQSDLEALAARLGVNRKVDFGGYVLDPYPHYEQAQIFALPSVIEGFPMTILEAMAHGLPLLGYEVCSGVNVQIRHTVNGFLSSGGHSVGSLGTDLARLMSDGELRARMGEQSKRIYEEEFSPAVIYPKWEDMILEAAQCAGVGSGQPPNIQDMAVAQFWRMIEAGPKAAMQARFDRL